ncbi:hypothetical protein DFH05DRAFT_1598567 [Lentinula detonsa]|uniref:Uncharacterized protein n=1 Tax=Lentinula detonsa TaxID=2804962 RepID=A0A9W8P4U6_9AGAR|nr:hypothetical protein DFH05DRAFT_1598567 [Lentinula detonsa]
MDIRTFPTANRSKIDCYAHHPIELPVANESRNRLVCSRSPTRYTPATHPTENKSIHTYATPYATLRPTHTRSPYAGQKTSPTRTRFLLFTLRPTPTLRPHAMPNQQNESALDSFAVVHLRPTHMPDRKRVRVGLVFWRSPYTQPTRYARPTKRVRFGLVCGRSPYAQPTRRTENESALDSFSGVHPTPNPHAMPDRQNESALDSFAVVHPMPNPHAGQKTSLRWTRFLAFTLHPTHTLRPTNKTSPLWTRLRSFTLRPTHTLCPTDKTSLLWTRLRSFTLRPTHTPDRKRVRVGLVFWRSPYTQPTRYARPTKRVRFGLV